MFEVLIVLWDRLAQKAEHVRFNVRVGVFVYCQAAGRVPREKHANSVAGFGNTPLNLRSNFEHNSDAHIKSSLVGSSVTIPFSEGKLLLGRWQGIYLCEFDGARERTVLIITR